MSTASETPMPIDLDEDTKEFHQYAAAAVDLSSAHVSSRSVLSVVRSARNWELNTRQNYLYRMNIAPLLTESSSGETMDDDMMLPPIPLDPSVQIYLPSPSGKKVVIIKKEQKDGKENDELTVEVWEGSSLTCRIRVGGKTTHGKMINDPSGFGMPSWSPDEKNLLYSAERLPATTFPFWSKTKNGIGDKEKDSHAENQHRGGQSVLGQGQTESWGECYSKQEAILDLYILNLSTGRLGRVRNVPTSFDEDKSLESLTATEISSSITLGQGVWHPKSSKIAFTGWSAGQPKRLGMVYCKNRASKIYESEVGSLLEELAELSENEKDEVEEDKDENYTCISNDLFFSRSPRYVGENLVFLGSGRAFVSHDACMALYRWDKEKESNQNVVPTVETPSSNGAKVSGLGFPGLFLGQLPVNCGIDSNFLVTTSLWGSFQRVIRVNIKNGDVHLIEVPQMNELGSQSLCTVSANGDLVISEASCDRPASLWIVKKRELVQDSIKESGRIVANAQRVATFSPIAASTFSPVQPTTNLPYDMQVVSIDSDSIDGAASYPIQALLLLPKNRNQKVPMVVVPHGGPHGCSASAFAPGIAHLASKYAVLLPNYRGSTGFGQSPLNSLLTRIGRVDVEDVMLCTRHAIDNFSVVDGERVGICGGSHGGFLTAHCTSQYPEFFKAAAMRNPVTNIASMITSSDIPDWCLGEVMGEYDQSLFRGPTSNQITKMYEKSPVSLVHQVKTPTLVALGLVDLRVPPSQGLEWFHSLRSLGVPTKLLKYPQDCHSLNLVTTEADHWMHIRHWFDKYL
eukprot:CAMPEP_0168200904 /NCGR_PEP_ID=MMETSP0139_2-20121125/23349_1 /TAXON_ID=44445 /ORGANISM="Pseudo-nitzschia australis, Strain 10249 10 AB" /LENGTH=798 /DNA_ID=CAMNT_0008126279 /DNA_START=257 /DNA_END=2656 /DNA_ORIENTATION=+